jgi:hypothetical protein
VLAVYPKFIPWLVDFSEFERSNQHYAWPDYYFFIAFWRISRCAIVIVFHQEKAISQRLRLPVVILCRDVASDQSENYE